MTRRLTPRAIKPRGELMLGCREVELTSMQPADAVEFFHKQKIKGTHAEIEAACTLYGYHPLSLRLLAGRILKDFENPADIVVAQKFKIDGDIIQQKHHVLEVSYNSLPPHEQKLLSTIACFRSPVELKTLEAIAKNKDSLNGDLHDLVARGLLHFDEKNKKFDLHPIVRRFAYDRFTAPQRTDAHVILVVYFEAIPEPKKIEKLEDLTPVIELYHHMVRAGNFDEACDLIYNRLADTIFYKFSAYQTYIELLSALFPDGIDTLPRLKKEGDQAWALGALANAYSVSGQPHRSVPLYKSDITILEKMNDKKILPTPLVSVSSDQLLIGSMKEAEHNLRRGIDLFRDVEDEFGGAVGHDYLGRILSYRGVWQEAEQELNIGLKLFDNPKSDVRAHWMGVTYSFFALQSYLMARSENNQSSIEIMLKNTIEAIKYMEEFSKAIYPIKREYVRNFWLLGTAYLAHEDLDKAEENLSKAISLDRQINMVDHEADILLDLARLRYEQKNFEEAKSLADEALLITERCGYVLQGADVKLFLAQYALEQEKDKAKAKRYAEEALKLATCDGPPYYYKVAYEEAERFLEKLKE